MPFPPRFARGHDLFTGPGDDHSVVAVREFRCDGAVITCGTVRVHHRNARTRADREHKAAALLDRRPGATTRRASEDDRSERSASEENCDCGPPRTPRSITWTQVHA